MDIDEKKKIIVEQLEKKIKKKKLSKEAKTKVWQEFNKLKMMSPMSAEAAVVRNYIDWILDLPWETSTKDALDIEEAQSVLDNDHYGLEKIKKRIIEFLAVRKLKHDMHGPILCFVGPPGVGKTSLGKSIAGSTSRE